VAFGSGRDLTICHVVSRETLQFLPRPAPSVSEFAGMHLAPAPRAMSKRRTAVSRRRRRGRLPSRRVTRAEIDRLTRRLAAAERRVDDLRLLSVSLVRQIIRLSAATPPGGDATR
jgi:hypothetical protein